MIDVEIKTEKPKRKPKARVVQEKYLKIKLVKSLIGYPESQRKVARGLGLRKISSAVIRKETPEVLGMIRKISHVLKVEGVDKP